MSNKHLGYSELREAVSGAVTAFRMVSDLDPAGGDGDKVFPPTYRGGVYAWETRIIGGQPVKCVLLDSVQSQANRLELTLLDWHRNSPPDLKPFPLVQIDFRNSKVPEVGLFSALEAPHRIADAVFLASEINEGDGRPEWKPFRHPEDPSKSSTIGRIVDEASPANAAGLFGLCPTALLFGMWDSHGARGGLGEKFQRTLVSEVFGVGATEDNRRPASRIDPLLVVAGESVRIKRNDDRTWSVDEKGKSRLSEVGLGNVVPSLKVRPEQRRNYESEYNHGGVTIQFARQIAVLSLPALRRLRFPLPGCPAEVQRDAEIAARTTLAALGLAAFARQWAQGFSLRSRCDLVPRGELVIHAVSPGQEQSFRLDPAEAAQLVYESARKAVEAGLPWPPLNPEPPWKDGCLTLRPNERLVEAVAKSRLLAAEERG